MYTHRKRQRDCKEKQLGLWEELEAEKRQQKIKELRGADMGSQGMAAISKSKWFDPTPP